MNQAERQYRRWHMQLKDNIKYTEELKLIRDCPTEIQERFSGPLGFGTAGLRGIMGLGTNRINSFTIGQVTQGLANYLQPYTPHAKVAIAYDSRIDSERFAKETACILAASEITVYLYQELMPTPALSYAVREYHCDAGIVITASHNHAHCNGYKVYGNDGSQIKPDVAQAITEQINAVDIFTDVQRMDYYKAVVSGRISFIPEHFVQQYLDRAMSEMINTEACVRAQLKVVYTPLHGAGYRSVKAVLREAGIAFLTVVPEQMLPDGHFPTCPEPNPENPDVLKLGLDLCRSMGADLLIATDPDADRVAVAVRSGDDYRILTGNEVGVLLLDYICTARKAAGTMPENPVAVKSIVSTKMADIIAQAHGVEMRTVPTGFKYVGQVLHDLEQDGEADRFIFGFEESCGYLTGGYVRDKDAVGAAVLIAEMASACHLKGKTLAGILDGLYTRYGVLHDYSESLCFDNSDIGIQEIMQWFRDTAPSSLGMSKVINITDYLDGFHHIGDNSDAFPAVDMLGWDLDDGCSLIIRPSGTEAKLKIYYSIPGIAESEIFESAVISPALTAAAKTDFLHRYYHGIVQEMISRLAD